jgi:hypothetical protein
MFLYLSLFTNARLIFFLFFAMLSFELMFNVFMYKVLNCPSVSMYRLFVMLHKVIRLTINYWINNLHVSPCLDYCLFNISITGQEPIHNILCIEGNVPCALVAQQWFLFLVFIAACSYNFLSSNYSYLFLHYLQVFLSKC